MPATVSPVGKVSPVNTNVSDNGSLYQRIFIPVAIRSGVVSPKQIVVSLAAGADGTVFIVRVTESAELSGQPPVLSVI